jgi:hypothetical protein
MGGLLSVLMAFSDDRSERSQSGYEISEQYRRAGSSGDQTQDLADAGIQKFRCARILITGIELMHMIKKKQIKNHKLDHSPTKLFYSLAA